MPENIGFTSSGVTGDSALITKCSGGAMLNGLLYHPYNFDETIKDRDTIIKVPNVEIAKAELPSIEITKTASSE